MTTTQTSAFEYVDAGTAYNGSPMYEVRTPAGRNIGYVARSGGMRGTTWYAHVPLTLRSTGGFRNREKAAEYLARVAGEEMS
jgi:hypothetical protein